MIKLSDVKVGPQYRTRVRYRLLVLGYAWQHGPAAAGRHYGISARTIRRWRKRWRRGGVEGVVPSYPRHRVRRVPPPSIVLIVMGTPEGVADDVGGVFLRSHKRAGVRDSIREAAL